jgi:hypothetical protein
MSQVIVYVFVNAGLLALFACLWAIDRKLKPSSHRQLVARRGVEALQ